MTYFKFKFKIIFLKVKPSFMVFFLLFILISDVKCDVGRLVEDIQNFSNKFPSDKSCNISNEINNFVPYESWMEIDLQAVRSNINKIRTFIDESSKLCVVLKSNAYGHGLLEIALTSEFENINCFGINNNHEAEIVRKNLKKAPSLYRLRPASQAEIESGLQYNIVEVIRNYEEAEKLSKIIQRQNDKDGRERKVPVNIYFPPLDMNELQKFCSKNGFELCYNHHKKLLVDRYKRSLLNLYHHVFNLKGLELQGIFSHFYTDDEDKIKIQNLIFKEITDEIRIDWNSKNIVKEVDEERDCSMKERDKRNNSLLCHVSSSASIVNSDEADHDLVRAGMLVYGAPNRNGFVPEGIMPVMSIKAPVIEVYNPLPFEHIGYNPEQIENKPTRIALLPIGYSQGISAKGQKHVLIHGEKFPVLSINQDQMYIDISKSTRPIQNSDVAVLLGKDGDSQLTIFEITSEGERPDQLLIALGNYFSLQKSQGNKSAILYHQ